MSPSLASALLLTRGKLFLRRLVHSLAQDGYKILLGLFAGFGCLAVPGFVLEPSCLLFLQKATVFRVVGPVGSVLFTIVGSFRRVVSLLGLLVS